MGRASRKRPSWGEHAPKAQLELGCLGHRAVQSTTAVEAQNVEAKGLPLAPPLQNPEVMRSTLAWRAKENCAQGPGPVSQSRAERHEADLGTDGDSHSRSGFAAKAGSLWPQ